MTILKLRRMRWLLAAAVVLSLWSGQLMAQTDEGDAGAKARQNTEQAIDARQQTQQRQDDWSSEKSALVARYRAAKANVEWLNDRKAEEEDRVAAIEGRISELSRRLDEADRLESSMQDTLQVIFDRLDESVRHSLPFLPAERRLRLESLAGELVRPDVASGEKMRRLLESLQVEAGYAATIEVYQDQITVSEAELHADILRLGRVALFWRTPDGERVGTYDQASNQWVELPGSASRNIALAMEMATRMRPMELIGLPLGRIGQ